MAHLHSVYDTDMHFSINTITREIKNESFPKKWLVQNDHNSERFTFELQRFIEGHDMSLCDKIEIHYINVSANTTEQSADVYLVDDMQKSPADDNIVIFSWLISGNATKYAGTLNFLIRFVCLDGATIEYAWNTAVFDDITIASGMNNGEMVIAEYSDVLEAWLEANKAEWDLIAKETTQAWMENHPEAIEQATDKWLNEHPEVTTTVQDGSLTKEKFTNDLKLATIKDYITPQMYGAVGDGVTDDSDAFQRCFDDAKFKVILIPGKKYVLGRSIKLDHSIGKYTIQGMQQMSIEYSAPEGNPEIICHENFLENTSETSFDFTVNMENVAIGFTPWGTDHPHSVFYNMKLYESKIRNVKVVNSSTVIYGSIKGVCVIDSCRFMSIGKAFIDDSFRIDKTNTETPNNSDRVPDFPCVDSFISNCYFNGYAQQNPVLFKVKDMTTISISDCYIDFFKNIFGEISIGIARITGVTFNNCVLDYIWRVMGVSTTGESANVIAPLVFNGCMFLHSEKALISNFFTNPDEDMIEDKEGAEDYGQLKKCGGFIVDIYGEDWAKSPSLNNIKVHDCSFSRVDYPFYIATNDLRRFEEYGNNFSNCANTIYTNLWIAPKDYDSLRFDSLQWKKYSTLPKSTITDEKTGFMAAADGTFGLYNNKPVVYVNKNWMYLDGEVITT